MKGGGYWRCAVKHRESARQWREDDPDRAREVWVRWAAANPEKRRESGQRWRAANLETKLASVAQWRAANPDKVRENFSRWAAQNPEKVKARRNKYRALKAGAEHEPWTHQEIYERDGGLCQYCELELPPYTYCPPVHKDGFTVDHVIPLSRGGRDASDNLMLCCHLCNAKKGNGVVMDAE